MSIPSIQDRIETAIHRATLLQLALGADLQVAGLDLEDVTKAAVPLVREINDQLHFLKLALEKQGVLAKLAPSDDDPGAGN